MALDILRLTGHPVLSSLVLLLQRLHLLSSVIVTAAWLPLSPRVTSLGFVLQGSELLPSWRAGYDIMSPSFGTVCAWETLGGGSIPESAFLPPVASAL